MRKLAKENYPVAHIRRFLEPGPVVLVSSAWRDRTDIMTMGWHTVMEFVPSLVGCVISRANASFGMIRKSGECVINIPAARLAGAIVGIGNTSGADTDKFARFGLTPVAARSVAAPMIAECFANLECRVVDTRLVRRYDFFVLEVVRAHAVRSQRVPTTLHYRGDGLFMVAGPQINLRRKFDPRRL